MPPASRIHHVLGVVIAIAVSRAVSSGYASSNDESHSKVLDLIPPDVPCAIVIPNLKAFSDELTQCLEGMERAQFLLGSRPLDQLKSASGLNVGVDDLGGLAVVMIERDESWTPVVLIPVTDAQAFLEGNFASRDGDQYTRGDGTVVTARDLGSHVALSTVAQAVRSYEPQAGFAGAIESEFGAAGRIHTAGDMFVMIRQEFGNRVAAQIRAQSSEIETPLALNEPFWRSALIAVDVDPLALIVRGLTRLEQADSDLIDSEATASLNALPDKPFYWALGADVTSLAAMRALFPQSAFDEVPDWVWSVQDVQCAAYPSPAGLAGGLLNDAPLVVRTNDPTTTRAAIKDAIQQAQNSKEMSREVVWQDSKPVKDIGEASAFEIRTVDAPPSMAQVQVIEQLIFGRNGIRGFVSAQDDSVIVTFSQRPAVLAGVLDAMGNSEGSLEASTTLATMRNWMPEDRDLEMYIGVAQLTELSRQVLGSFGLATANVPKIDPGAPPVGFACDVSQSTIETSLIIPAQIAAAIFDEAAKHAAAFLRMPKRNSQDETAPAKGSQ